MIVYTRDLSGFAEPVRLLDVDVDPDRVRLADLGGERLQRRTEPLVAEHDGLERERQVTQLANGRALAVHRPLEHAGGVVDVPRLDRVEHRVEHQGDPREVLHRSVVQEQRDPPTLVLLGRDQPVERLAAASRFSQ